MCGQFYATLCAWWKGYPPDAPPVMRMILSLSGMSMEFIVLTSAFEQLRED